MRLGRKTIGMGLGLAMMLSLADVAMAEDMGSMGGSMSGSVPATIPSMVLNAGFGLSLYSGNYQMQYDSGRLGYNVGATVLSQVTDAPLYIGVDFALNFWGFTPPLVAGEAPQGNRTLSAVGIQVLPAAVYRFSIDTVPKLTPYFGFALGPHFFILRDRTVVPGGGEVKSDSSTNVYLELLAKPGVEYHFTDNLAAAFEPKFGLLNFDFILMPTASLTLTL